MEPSFVNQREPATVHWFRRCSVIIPFKLLGTNDYRIWSSAVKLALQARNKYGFVDGTCLRASYASSDVSQSEQSLSELPSSVQPESTRKTQPFSKAVLSE
ncbi:ribonuclease H-like domain-containing protein [Tanacetum coccineum]